MASGVPLGLNFLGEPTDGRPVLAIFAEEEELWRRQINIARALGVELGDFRNRLFLEPRVGKTNILADNIDGRLEPGPFYEPRPAAVKYYSPGRLIMIICCTCLMAMRTTAAMCHGSSESCIVSRSRTIARFF